MFSPSGGGLDVLDLKSGAILTTLIPKLAEGMFHVIAKFNETNEYVLYYHSGHKTLKVFRMEDGEMIANYRVPSNLTSLESTSDGNHVAMGMVDGNISILTIADPKKRKMSSYVKNLPSRTGMQAVITNYQKLSNLVRTRVSVNKSFNRAKSPGNANQGENDDSRENRNKVAGSNGNGPTGKAVSFIESDKKK